MLLVSTVNCVYWTLHSYDLQAITLKIKISHLKIPAPAAACVHFEWSIVN